MIKLPLIQSKRLNKSQLEHNKTDYQQTVDQKQDDMSQVTKLDEWSMNKPTKKAKTIINTHNISFLYRSSAIRNKQNKQLQNTHKFMEVQLYIAKLDNQLQKIGDINYFSIYKNLQYCSGMYENSFNAILKTIAKHKASIQTQVDQIQFKLKTQRQEHLQKVHAIQQSPNQEYKNHMNQVRQTLEQQQKNIKPLKKYMKSLDLAKTKVLKFCLSLGYDIRQEGLIWIIKQLGEIPKVHQFPQFLSDKQINFIITKYTNEYEISHAQTKMKVQVHGKTINQAYEYVNRRKRRQLSLIKQNDQMMKIYATRMKDYSPEKHAYLNQDTLQIAQSLQKDKPKPTRYEVIYKQATKKLNKICKQKIHPQLIKNNKQAKKISKNQNKQNIESIRRKQKRNSTIIIEQFSKMLNLSINQTKKLEQLYTKEEKQFEEILRHIRVEKYSQPATKRVNRSMFQQNSEDGKLRNPISILGCLVGWKKAEKIIEQEMFGF